MSVRYYVLPRGTSSLSAVWFGIVAQLCHSPVSQNVTTLSRYNSGIGLHESILTIFDINVIETVGNQKLLFPQHPLTQRCTVALPDFNQSLA